VSRLEDVNISLAAEGPVVSVYTRGNCLAAAGGSQGGTGLMTERGLAYLVWRDGQPYLAAKGSETPATAEDVETIRRFTEDLKWALAEPAPDTQR
jgi:hypothetical protein